MKNLVRCTFLFALVGLAAACKSGDGGTKDPFEALRNNPDVNKNAWYNSMAQVCSEGEPRPGCTFKYDGTKVTLSQDPTYAQLDGFTVTRTGFIDHRVRTGSEEVYDQCAYRDSSGFCIAGYITRYYSFTETFTNYNVFVETPDGRFVNVKDWGLLGRPYADQLGGWSFEHRLAGSTSDVNDVAIISPAGIRYSFDGNALNAAQLSGGAGGNDVVGSAAEIRADQVKGISEVLQAKFSLDADVSVKAAASLVDWSEIGSKRARTHADMAAFSKRVYGIELGRIEDVALLARDGKAELALKEMDSLVGEAASNWKTSPETMREVLNFFYGNLMN
jgi:hypothetical protein